MNTLNYTISELDNGLRIISERLPHVKSMSMGIWVGVGSRYEEAALSGVTHFIEHMLFKGTTSRSAKDIAETVDIMGGQINAFTSKECTCYYIRALDEHFPVASDILADMLLNSVFDPQEMDKEREVIIEEIKMYEDAPDELVSDLFAEMMWPDHPLGRRILGSEETLAAMTPQTLRDYMTAYYTGENIVISVVGNIEHEAVVAMAQRYFGHLPRGHKNTLVPVKGHQGDVRCFPKDIGQTQICIGVPGIAVGQDEVYPMSLLNAYLGGGMSSQLVQKIREEMGLAYSVYSYHSAYQDNGVLLFSAATRPENCQQVIDMIIAEGRRVAREGIRQADLDRVLSQFKGGLYLGLEGVNSRMNKLGRSLLSLGKVISPEETVEALGRVTPETVQQLAARIFQDGNYTVTVLGPVETVTVTP